MEIDSRWYRPGASRKHWRWCENVFCAIWGIIFASYSHPAFGKVSEVLTPVCIRLWSWLPGWLAQICFYEWLLSQWLLLINSRSLWFLLCHGSAFLSQIPEPSNACYPIVISANQLLANFGSSVHKTQICIPHIDISYLWPKEDKYNTPIIEKRGY